MYFDCYVGRVIIIMGCPVARRAWVIIPIVDPTNPRKKWQAVLGSIKNNYFGVKSKM